MSAQGATDGGSVYVTIESEGLPAFEAELDKKLKLIAARIGGQFAKRFSESYGKYLLKALPIATRRAVLASIKAAGTIKIPIEVDTRAADTKLRELARTRTTKLKVDVDTGGAEAKLKALTRDRGRVNVGIGSSGGAGAESEIRRVESAARDGVPAVSGLALALASIGPIAIPALAATAAGVVALGTTVGAVGVAVGVGAIAFHGIGDAVKALGAQSGSSAKQVQAVGKNAAQAAAHAFSLKQAAQGVTDAEQRLGDAQRATKAAQTGLNTARQEALKTLQDLKQASEDGALSEKEAALALKRAQDDLNKSKIDPRASKLDQEEAALAVERARQNLKDQKRANADLTKDKAKADKAGIEGSVQVLAAQKAIRDAKREELRAARDVANAIQSEHVAQLQAKASVAATVPEVNKVKTAFDNLTPAGKRFARYIFSLRPEWTKLQSAAQSGFLPALETAIENLRPFMPNLVRFVGKVARAMGEVAKGWSKTLGDKSFRRLFDYIDTAIPRTITKIGSIGSDVADIFANLFTASAPAGEKLLGDIGDMFDKLNAWTGSKKGQASLKKYFDDAVPVVESIAKLLGSVGNLFLALSGNQGTGNFLDGLTSFINKAADFVRSHPDEVRKALWGILGALVALKALKFGADAVSGLVELSKMTGLPRLLGGISLGIRGMALEFGIGLGVLAFWAIALVALGVALVVAYKKFPAFRNVVDTVLHVVGDTFTWLWKNAVQPALKAIGILVRWLYREVIKPTWELIDVAIQVAWAAIQITFGLIRIGIKVLGRIFRGLYSIYVKPMWDDVKPILDAFGHYIGKFVAPAFKAGVDAIGKIWSKLKDTVKEPVEFLVNTVINKGIIGPYNSLAKKFGVGTVDLITLPWATGSQSKAPAPGSRSGAGADHGGRAMGGVLPGFTPGRDVHQFYSPTAGKLALSGGEAIMRPEWARAVGSSGVAAMNAAAAGGAFSAGGIWDDARGLAGKTLGKVGDIASSLNPAAAITKLVEHLLADMPGHDSAFGQLLGGVAKTTAKNVVGSIGSALGLGGGGGGVAVGGAPSSVTGNAAIVKAAAAGRGWGDGAQWNSLYSLIMGESGFKNTAQNPTSSAYGMFQFLDSTWGGVGGHKTSDPGLQALYGLKYIASSYGNPVNAYSKWSSRSPHWYDSGGDLAPGLTLAMNGTGKPEKVLTSTQWNDISKIAGNVVGSPGTVDRSIHLTSDYHNVARDIERLQRREALREKLIPNR